MINYMSSFNAVVLINGHGSAGQFGDLADVDWIVDHVVKDLNERFGTNWLVLYGGEPFQAETPTIAYPARRLHMVHHKTILAVQCDFYGQYVLEPTDSVVYEHLTGGALYQYPTQYHLNRQDNKRV